MVFYPTPEGKNLKEGGIPMINTKPIELYIHNSIYYPREVMDMQKAKLFANGGSQAVRLPKNFRFDGDEVMITRVGDAVILTPADDPWNTLEKALSGFTDDCLRTVPEDLPLQERDWL